MGPSYGRSRGLALRRAAYPIAEFALASPFPTVVCARIPDYRRGVIEAFVAGSGTVIVDDRFFPVLISTWSGRANETTVRAFFEWSQRQMQRARKEGVKILQISDATDAERPDPVTRRLLAELTDLQGDEAADLNYTSLVVLENPVIRGAMTAIGWLTRRKLELVAVADMPTAIRRAREELTKAGVKPPADLDPGSYVRPTPKLASSD
jgi:hypothetical protein